MREIAQTDPIAVLPIPRVRLHWPAWVVRLWPVSGATSDIAALDGLRGVAVLLVLFEHLFLGLPNHSTDQPFNHFVAGLGAIWAFGGTGVDLFFILSGFLLFLPYARTLHTDQKFPDTRKFYLRRALRILPAYWVALALILIFQLESEPAPFTWQDIIAHIFLLQNYSAHSLYAINRPFWTMAVESQFYVLLPLIAYGLLHVLRLRRPRITAILFVGLLGLTPLVAVAGALVKHNQFLNDHFSVFDALLYMPPFGIGIACSLFYVAVTHGKMPFWKTASGRRIIRWSGVGGAFIALCIAVVGLLSSRIVEGFSFLLYTPVISLCYGAILLATLFGWSSWGRFFAHPALRFTGNISYSLYIWHPVFFERGILPFAGSFQPGVVTVAVALVAIAVTLVPFCFIFYTCIERPFNRIRRRQH